jgi:trehalose-phosphatase
MDLRSRIEQLSQVPILLVASDYDGTLSPLVDDPRSAKPHPDALVALRNLTQLPQTHVAIISGRALRDLHSLAQLPDEVHLVGSHGGEFDLDFHKSLPPSKVRLRHAIRDHLMEIAGSHEGFYVEEKPGSLAFHYRNAPPHLAHKAFDEIRREVASRNGVHVREGKKVIELSVVETSKGAALEAIRHRVGASAAIYFGDDTTDEEAFAHLTGPDVAVKVGEGESRAPFRVADPTEAARILAHLFELREEWLEQAQFPPIEQHSMLSDQRTMALTAPGGRITWFCAPRVDSPALFSELLGGPVAGYFAIRPAEDSSPGEQAYRPGTLVLETRWPSVTVTDFLDVSQGRAGQRAGRTDLVRMAEGKGEVEVEFSPRLDFGRTPTQLAARDGGLEIEDTLDPVVLFSPGVSWTIEDHGRHQTARARVALGKEPLILELRYGTGNLNNRKRTVEERLAQTAAYWSAWSDTLELPRTGRDLVARSAVVLKGLCYAPTGAVIAAATTSLPEHVGGVRNWDYRYCWLRDGAMAAAALVKLGSASEAVRFLDWVLALLEDVASPERFRPVYTVTGGDLQAEADIAELSGYRSSRPVRVGNAAAGQIQLDVFGPVVDLVHLLMRHDVPLSSEHWRLTTAMVSAVQSRWKVADHGIWEVRTRRRHHVHSKLMCWVTVDRGCRIAQEYLGRSIPEWETLRDEIRESILRNGWNEKVGAFGAAYSSGDVDASVLEIGLRGLLPPDDPRFRSTVDVIQERLAKGPTVYRYRYDDGLPGFEGGFHLCAAWLIQALAMTGRREEGMRLFEEMGKLAGPTGLLSEEYGPRTERTLGNYPQAYSHLGLIEAALTLERTR